MSELPSHARVVIVGGGIIGVGLLYHLALEGWTDVVLCEKGELTSGSTWHAAGQCPHFNGSYSLSKIHVYGTELYPRLAELTGHEVSWHGCGGIRLAVTDEEVDWFKRVHAMSKMIGYEAHVIGPDEIRAHHPFLETFGVKAGFLTVTDGHVAPADVTNAMAAGARKLGATVSRRNRVTGIEHLASGEWKVKTEKGDIVCQHVVNAAGSYADVVGSWTGHNVPIANMLHHYVITEPVKALIDMEKELPVVRDPYSHCYLREETNGVLIGPYETEGAHTCFDDGLSWDFESELVAPELDRLTPWLERATERFPLFAEAGLKSVVSGAITHTPDGNFLLGPAPGAPGYWMAAGVSIGVCQGGGAGKYLAQWMVHGAAEINMAEFDPRRFGNWATLDYAKKTSINDYQHMYTVLPPGMQHEVGREVRVSSLYERLKSEGALFQQVAGWERPRWYDKTGKGETYSYRRSNWVGAVAEEVKAVRERVGLMDLSTFAKYDIKGRDAHGFLDRVLANRMPRKDGGIVLAHLLTEGGRIESEMTVTRLAPDHFYALSGATAQMHDLSLLENAVRPGEDVTITDITEAYGTLVLAGPRAREVLAKVTEADLSNAGFRWLTGREIEVAGVPTRALRVGYVGELGWELHAPMKDLPKLFDALVAAGKPFDMRLFGTYAMNSMRIEKAYRGMGAELTNEISMIEADMERFVALDKEEFVGRAATLASKQQGARISLVYLSVDAEDADCLGAEPVYQGDRLVGVTTSGGFGFATGKSLAFAYVEPELTAPGTPFEIEIIDRRVTARIEAEPVYDPENKRLRA
ncbi:MAG: FAD-dependent oxidoreductase [Hyphomicrobiaceae bacterium]